MASQDNTLDVSYDNENDVLYASLGSPQAALSYEVSKDIWLDYIPPNRRVLGVTVLNFLEHYPVANRDTVLQEARTIVQDLLKRYPLVPLDQERVTIRINPAPWLQSSSTTTAGTYATPLTKVVGFVSHFDTVRIQGNRVASKDTGA
jgi:uncharacterized protein YuzE